MGTTAFSSVYNRFLGKITDDMYMELTPLDTLKDLQNLLINALPEFEFPRVVLTDYQFVVEQKPVAEVGEEDFVIGEEDGVATIDNSYFNNALTVEEENILALLMMVGWLQRQVTTVENIRMKYSGADFKFTSQANHIDKLLTLLAETQRQAFHMQRLYKRRKTDSKGRISSNWSSLSEVSALDN